MEETEFTAALAAYEGAVTRSEEILAVIMATPGGESRAACREHAAALKEREVAFNRYLELLKAEMNQTPVSQI